MAARRPWLVLGLWFGALVLAVVAIGTLLSLESDQRLTNDPESYQADRLVEQNLPRSNLVEDVVVVRSERYTTDQPEFRRFTDGLVERGRAKAEIVGPPRPSSDRHALLVPLRITPPQQESIEDVIEIVETADRDPAFDVSVTGEWTIDRDFNRLALNDLKEGEAFFGAPAALVVLVFVFGALAAAVVPIVLALVSIVLSLGLSALIGQIWTLSLFIQNMITAVGLALGIDYSLFVLSRYRDERALGRDKLGAIAAAGATSSRAVLFSGSAFVIALLGLLLVPDNIMRSLATGAILAGIVSVLAALTLVPAILSLLGDRVNSIRVPIVGRVIASGGREGRFWGRAARAVMGRPVLGLVLVVGLLLAAAIPVLDLKTGFAAVSTFPDGYPSKKGLIALDRDFRGGEADPVQIVVQGEVQEPATQAAMRRLVERLQSDERFGATSLMTGGGNDMAVISTPLPGGATDPEPVAAVRQLRSEYIPEAFSGVDARVLVGGETARDIDYFDTMDFWLPLVIAFVLALSFVLLTVAFRSIVVATKAILLNLLVAAAAYGVLVLVFEKGVGNELFGFQQYESIVAWVPLFLFCILFGLSMDYHVFLLSRIRERYAETGDNSESVAFGVSTTARLITGAALIIIVVFIGFATGDLVMFQQMGFGVAVALLIDATLVRSVLVPAAMVLLGERNWYLPRWLEWLPDVHVEGEGAATKN